jgi:twinkle protein
MATPDELNLALSNNIELVMGSYFPLAIKRGASYSMGDFDGSKGGSTGVYRGSGGVYLAKDNATGECTNILNLMSRKFSSWTETHDECRKLCGIVDVKPIMVSERPPEPAQDALGAIRGTDTFKYLNTVRGLSESTLMKYEVRTHKRSSQHNENFWAAKFFDPKGHLVMVKSTGINKNSNGKKDIWSTAAYSTLWNWNICDNNTKSIAICEGEIDAMSLHQLGADVPCLSVPSGCSNLGWIENDFEALERFETIYLAFDNDTAGEKASREVAKRLGITRCKRIDIPTEFNDINDMLLSDSHIDIGKLFDRSSTYDPKQLKSVNDMEFDIEMEIERHEVEEESNPFLWPDLRYRHRYGELTVVGGYPGHGKSQWVYQSTLNELINNDRKVCIASFEIPAKSMLFNMMWMNSGRRPTVESFKSQMTDFVGNTWFIEGQEGTTTTWESLKSDFLYANKRYGCDLFIVDALMHISNKDDYSGQEKIAKQAAKFCVDHDVTILLICHCDAKKAGSGHVPELEDILGGQGIGAACHAAVMLWRNKEKEKKLEAGEDVQTWEDRPDGKFYVPKQRANGITIYRDIWFDKRSRRFSLEPITYPSNLKF